MDPLSITASIIAVLQAASAVVSVCYDYQSALKEAPWGLTKVTDEVRSLRSVLETLVTISTKRNVRTAALELICTPNGGLLSSCLAELMALEKKLSAPSWYGKIGSRRRAAIQAIGWRLKDIDATKALENIERFKSTLTMAMTADEARQGYMNSVVMSRLKDLVDISCRTLLSEVQTTIQKVNEATGNIQESFATFLESFTSMRLDDRKRAILCWLSPIDPAETHEAVTKAHQDGTCSWLFHSKEFSEWNGAEQSFLWLSGFPGAGKTVLSSTAIDFLRQSQTKSTGFLAFFYFEFRRPDSQDPVNALGSILATLCLQLGTFPDLIELAYEQSMNSSGRTVRPDLSLLEKALVSLGTIHEITLVIDALDECNERGDLLLVLKNLGQKMLHTKILVTSRNEQDICDVFSDFPRIRLENRSPQIGHDIDMYVTKRLADDYKFRWLNDSIKSDIRTSLLRKADGMFRWVQCQLDEIANLKTIRAIRKALEELPEGLNQSYESILARVSNSNTEIMRRILLWLCFSLSPLTLEDIWEATTIEKDLPYLDEESRLSSPQDILDLCGNFLNVSDSTSEATLVHLSVKEFLLSSSIRNGKAARFAFSFEDANAELAVNCLTYLSFDEFNHGPCVSFSEYRNRITRYPLLRRLTRVWPRYATKSGQPVDLNRRIYRFFSPASRKQFMSWVQVLNTDKVRHWDFYNRDSTGLYYAASFGLEKTVQKFIEDGVDLNAASSRYGGTALHAAVIWEHTHVMEMLMKAGADPNQADRNMTSPLHTAAVRCHPDIVSLLLRFNASSRISDKNGKTPYDWAVRAGQTESQSLLLHGEAESGLANLV